PTSPGVPQGAARSTLNATYNDLDSVRALFDAHPQEIAAVIVEPVAGNMGCVPSTPEFLKGLRALCDQHGAVLIFDEVMTGFRVALGGAQSLYGITPDLTTLGKVIGGGLPVGAFGGKRALMELVSPAGKTYQAGTLSGNPLGMAAGLATLRHLKAHPEIYERLDRKPTALKNAIEAATREHGWPVVTQQFCSMLTIFFTSAPVQSWKQASRCDTAAFGRFFHAMLVRGVHLRPAQFEGWFFSADMGDAEFAELER